jgi:hypothetical protein
MAEGGFWLKVKRFTPWGAEQVLKGWNVISEGRDYYVIEIEVKKSICNFLMKN